MTEPKTSKPASGADLTPTKPSGNPDNLADSAPEREEKNNDYLAPEDYPPEDRMTPPAIQTGAARPTVVGEPDVDLTNPGVKNTEPPAQGDTGSTTPSKKP